MRNIYPILLSLLLFPLSEAFTQYDLKVDGLVTVEEDALLHVDGDAFIDGSGEIQNDGTIELTGDWQNDRPNGDLTYSGTTGQRLIRFIGNDLQTLGSTSGELLFQNVESTNNSADFSVNTAGIRSLHNGASGVMFDNVDVTVESVNLNNGDLIFDDNWLTIAAGGSISGFSDTSSVLHFSGDRNAGGGIRWMYSSADSVYEYPLFHDGIGLVHATVYFDKAPAFSLPGNFGHLEGRFAIAPPQGLGPVRRRWDCAEPVLVGPPGVNHISIDEMLTESSFGYWEITPFSNDATPEYIGQASNGWQYDIRLRTPKEIVSDFVTNVGADYLKIIKIPTHEENGTYIDFRPGDLFGTGKLWTNGIPSSSGRNYCDGMVQIVNYPSHSFPGQYDESTGVKAHDLNSFSRFGQGGNGEGGGLPIELLYLDANGVDNSYILVEWATATEINNEGFEVLRSEDGLNFRNIGWVNGNGTTSERQDYSFIDHDVKPNRTYYYRLNQIDFDRTSELTYIVDAQITADNVFTISEFKPNPSTSFAYPPTLEITTSEDKELNITVYNTLGQSVKVEDFDIQANVTNEVTLSDMNQYAAGTYYVIIKVDNEVYNRKLILTNE